jgi:hypothetical protein
VSEFKGSWFVCVLIVRSEIQAQFVAGTEAARIGHKRNPVAHFLPNGHSLENPAWQERGTRLAGGLIDCPQARPEVSRCDIDGVRVFVHILQDGDECRVRRCWRRVAALRRGRSDPDHGAGAGSSIEERWRVRLARARAIETAAEVHVSSRARFAFVFTKNRIGPQEARRISGALRSDKQGRYPYK